MDPLVRALEPACAVVVYACKLRCSPRFCSPAKLASVVCFVSLLGAWTAASVVYAFSAARPFEAAEVLLAVRAAVS